MTDKGIEVVVEAHRGFGASMSDLVSNLLVNAQIPFDRVTFRTKTIQSAVEKIDRKKYDSASSIADLTGIRVIVPTVGDVLEVKKLLSQTFVILEEVAHGTNDPAVFGYAGIHLIARLSPDRAALFEYERFENLSFEIQIRTILQHAWATISHSFDYKSDVQGEFELRRALHRVAGLLEAGDVLLQNYSDDASPALPEGPNSDKLLSIESAAMANGWREPTHFYSKKAMQRDLEANRRLRRTVEILEIESDPIAEMSEAPGLDDSLSEISRRCTERYYQPFAIGPDIVALWLIRRAPVAAQARQELSAVYRPELLDALVSIAD